MRITHLTAVAACLAFAGAACAQEPAEEAAATPASVEEDAGSGFNLRMPGEAASATNSGGFNLRLPGEEETGFRLPDDAVSANAFSDLPALDAPADEAPPAEEDDIIRLEP